MKPRIVWSAVAAASLAAIAVLTSFGYSDLSLSLGLAAISAAILSTRE